MGWLEEVPKASDEEVKALHLKQKIEELAVPVKHQNVTLVEILPSRQTDSIIEGLSKVHAKYRMMGLQTYRLHTDREKSFLTRKIGQWCESRSMTQSMTSGDDSACNGRVEAEIQQVKRQLRVTLQQAGVPIWSFGHVRHAMLEKIGCEDSCPNRVRRRSQWWMASRRPADEPVQGHATDGAFAPDDFRVDCEVWLAGAACTSGGGLRSSFRRSCPCWTAGGRCSWSSFTSTSWKAALGWWTWSPPRSFSVGWPTTSSFGRWGLWAGILGAWVAGTCPDVIAGRGEYGMVHKKVLSRLQAFETSSMAMVTSGGCGLQQVGSEKECPMCQSELQGMGEHGLMAPTTWPLECGEGQQLQERELQEHWHLKRFWSERLATVAIGEESGREHGRQLDKLEGTLQDWEESLEVACCRQVWRLWNVLAWSRAAWRRLVLGMENSSSSSASPAAVLQTYTVPLQTVKRNLEAMAAERKALLETTKAIQAVDEADLKKIPGYHLLEMAPAKIAATVKAPNGRKKVRVVICGNLLEKKESSGAGNGSGLDGRKGEPSPFAQYAGGVDGAALRTLWRKGAAEQWSIVISDVRTAFLLAPRLDQERLLVCKPPQLYVDCGLASPSERWLINGAMYGLQESPHDWSCFRDSRMARFAWQNELGSFQLRRTPEPNLWQIIHLGDKEEDEKAVGAMAVYVDDILITAPEAIAASALERLRQEWTSSEPEWIGEGSWVKFCGMELKKEQGALLLGRRPMFGTSWRDMAPSLRSSRQCLLFWMRLLVVPKILRAAQALLGELLWVSVRTRPDLCFGVFLELLGWGEWFPNVLPVFWPMDNTCCATSRSSRIFLWGMVHGVVALAGMRSWLSNEVSFAWRSFATPPMARLVVEGRQVLSLATVVLQSTGSRSSSRLQRSPQRNVNWWAMLKPLALGKQLPRSSTSWSATAWRMRVFECCMAIVSQVFCYCTPPMEPIGPVSWGWGTLRCERGSRMVIGRLAIWQAKSWWQTCWQNRLWAVRSGTTSWSSWTWWNLVHLKRQSRTKHAKTVGCLAAICALACIKPRNHLKKVSRALGAAATVACLAETWVGRKFKDLSRANGPPTACLRSEASKEQHVETRAKEPIKDPSRANEPEPACLQSGALL